MNLQQLLDFINHVSGKEQSGNVLSPQEYNTQLNAANAMLFSHRYGIPEQFSGRFSRAIYEDTQKITDSMSPFKVILGASSTPQLQVNASGEAQYPSGYKHVTSIRHQIFESGGVMEVPVDVVTDAELAIRLTDYLTKPTRRYPVAVFYKDFIQFYPKNLKRVIFTYLKHPVRPVYDYYITALGAVVYLAPGTTPPQSGVVYSGLSSAANNASASVELEWTHDDDQIMLANIILSNIGITLRANEIIQMAEKFKQSGE